MIRRRVSVILSVAHAAVFPYMAPLLENRDGSAVKTPAQWEQRRAEVMELVQDNVIGARPSSVPPLVSAEELNRTVFASGAASSFHRLTFDVSEGGAVDNVSFVIEVLHPGGVELAPVFLTQWNHRQWALMGLSRGYLSVVYPGGDTGDAAPEFQRAYPNATMMLIAARAFVASRVLDFILPQMPGINTSQVAITGHSRNGKQSLIAAALDERITAVVGSSPGAPISSPYAFSSHNFYGEGPDAGQAGNWWLKSTADYAAAPHTLPMDGHGILALIAPRACAVADGYTDHEGDDTFADEMGMRAASKVYDVLGAPQWLRLIHRPGDHHGYDDVNTYFDWFDHAFGRVQAQQFALAWAGQSSEPVQRTSWPQIYLTPAGFDWEVWKGAFGDGTPPPHASAPLEERVAWTLQLNKPTAPSVGSSYAEESTGRFSFRTVMMGNDLEHFDGGVNRLPLSFGDYVTGNVYWPASASRSEPRPAIVWLHPYSYSTGYAACYGSSDIIKGLVHAGFVVLAYDQVGHATRILEGGTTFYNRHGNKSSLFGHMVRDAQAALDFLACRAAGARDTPACSDHERHTGTYSYQLGKIPPVDGDRIALAGYSLGGNVALHTAALDKRVAAVASFAGFTPMRTDSLDRPTYGLRRLYDLHALVPRLGLFAEAPSQVPYDYDELLEAVAPRPTLLYTPLQDRDATAADIQNCVDAVQPAWGNTSLLSHLAPDDYTRMASAELRELVSWATSHLKPKASVTV